MSHELSPLSEIIPTSQTGQSPRDDAMDKFELNRDINFDRFESVESCSRALFN